MDVKIRQMAQMSKKDLMSRMRAIYFKLRDGLSLDEAEKEVDATAPPPPGFPHAIRERRRARNYRARASRRTNRLRAKHA